MMFFNRRVGERFVCQTPDGEAWVTVLSIRHELDCESKVRLGIAAPRRIPVHRAEIRERIRAMNRETLTGG